MNERGRNVLPMIGFIMILIVLLGGFSLAKNKNARKMLDQNHSTSTNTNRTDKPFEGIINKSGILSGYTVDESGELSTEGINKITIASVSSELNIYRSDSNKISAKYYGDVQSSNKDSAPYLEVIKEGNEAIVRIKYPTWHNVSFSEKTKLDVTIPDNWGEDLDIKNTSGSISANELKGDDISIVTISGSISIDKLMGKNIEIKSTSGAIAVDQVIASAKFTGSTISGKYAVNVIESREVDLNSTSGVIDVSDAQCDDFDARSISGDIDITLKKGNADIETTSGRIKIKFLDGFDTIKAKSISGKVLVSVPENSQFDVDIRTISGSIKCSDFSMKVNSSKSNELKGTVGSGGSQIDVNSASGNVEIIKN
jgi:DUF4097 and DUF4098 domain-containing protein YvlB